MEQYGAVPICSELATAEPTNFKFGVQLEFAKAHQPSQHLHPQEKVGMAVD